jgi:hypothetical protein
VNALQQPGEVDVFPAASGMLPANVDDPRFSDNDPQRGERARWTARSALVSDLTDGMGVTQEDARFLFWDFVREFLSAVGSGLLPR